MAKPKKKLKKKLYPRFLQRGFRHAKKEHRTWSRKFSKLLRQICKALKLLLVQLPPGTYHNAVPKHLYKLVKPEAYYCAIMSKLQFVRYQYSKLKRKE